MLEVLTAKQMKACDAHAIEDIGIPSPVLMERAAYAVSLEVMKTDGPVLVVCGTGNNGGDGYACARILHLEGREVTVFAAGDPAHMTEETKAQAGILRKLGVPFSDDFHASIKEASVIVDALLGIGITRDVREPYAGIIEAINAAKARTISIDVPSGVHADTGQIMGTAVRADITVAIERVKPGLLLCPGAAAAGGIVIARIGVTVPAQDPDIRVLEKKDLRQVLPARDPFGHKGTFGKVLLIAGSPGMCGASYLSAAAALHAGAGMVRILTPEANRKILQEMLPEAMISAWQTADEAEVLLAQTLSWADALVCGPGIGRGEDAVRIVKTVLSTAALPLVLDADGLNALSGDASALDHYAGEIVITPHLGEMCALQGTTVSRIREHPLRFAADFADAHNLTLVMKDARTITACPGGKIYINANGNSGMGTAGCGDVLSGILGALIAAGTAPRAAAPAAVTLHAAAGDLAAKKEGTHYMTARSVIAGLSGILKEIEDDET